MSSEKMTKNVDSASVRSTSTTSTLTSLKALLHKPTHKAPKPKSKPSPEQLAKEDLTRSEARANYFALR